MALTQKNKDAILMEIARLTYELKSNIEIILCVGCIKHALTTINMLTGIVLEKITIEDFLKALDKSNNPEIYKYYVDFIHIYEIEY